MLTGIEQLISLAKQAAQNSYSPYSNFRVGAALLAENGEIYCGCNIENASYGLTNCAERVAISSAIAAGVRTIQLLVVYTPTDLPTAPCGACRQFMREFATNDLKVICACLSQEQLRFQGISELLPHSFGPQELGQAVPRQVKPV